MLVERLSYAVPLNCYAGDVTKRNRNIRGSCKTFESGRLHIYDNALSGCFGRGNRSCRGPLGRIFRRSGISERAWAIVRQSPDILGGGGRSFLRATSVAT